jgi:hypothetical protein
MLHGLHIPEHAHGRHGTRVLDQPRRTRKLLMHRSEIDKIVARLGEAGVTLVPLSLCVTLVPCRCTSGTAGRRWRSPWRAAGGPSTSGRQSPSGTPTGRLPASSAIGYAGGDDAAAGRAETLLLAIQPFQKLRGTRQVCRHVRAGLSKRTPERGQRLRDDDPSVLQGRPRSACG